MAAAFDVSARLDEGRAVLDLAQAYVSASRLRGYANPDLTRYAGQVLDWYCALDGLDLNALDADCQMLRTAAVRSAAALNDVRAALVALPGGWRGQGAARATDFLAGHCDTAQRLVDALENSHSSATALRDELSQQVDRQVSATLAMAEQQRPEWPAAAQAVLAGDAGRDDAGEIVDSQVKPFVDKVIRGEWLVAMRSVADAVEDAYRGAIARVGALGGLAFEVPGDSFSGYAAPRGSVRNRIAAPVEAAAASRGSTAVPGFLDLPAAPWVPATTPAGPSAPESIASGIPQPAAMPASAMPASGTGMPALGWPALPEISSSGSGALPQSGLGATDIPALDVPRLGGSSQDDVADDELEDISPGEAESEIPAEAEDAEAEEAAAEAEDVDPQGDAPSAEPIADMTDDPAPATDCPPPAAAAVGPEPPAPEAEPEPATSAVPAAPTEPETPCEMAADELPQVGE